MKRVLARNVRVLTAAAAVGALRIIADNFVELLQRRRGFDRINKMNQNLFQKFCVFSLFFVMRI